MSTTAPANNMKGTAGNAPGPAGVRFVRATSLSKKWENALLAIRPLDYRQVANEHTRDGKTDEAARCRVLVVDMAQTPPVWIDQGEADIYWRVVIRELHEQCDAEYPWLAGRLVKKAGRPPWMELRPTTPEEMRAIAEAIADFVALEGGPDGAPAPT